MIDPAHKKVVLHTGSAQITIDSQGVKVLRQTLETGAPHQQQNNPHHSLMRAQQLQESRHNYQNPSFASSVQGQETSYNKYNQTNTHSQQINSNGMSGGGGANQANVSLSQRFSHIEKDKHQVSSMFPRQQHVEVVQNNECELQKASRNPAFSRSNPLDKSEKPSPQRELLSLARQIVRRAQESQQPGYKEGAVIHKSSLDNPNENTLTWIHQQQQQQNENTSLPTQGQLKPLNFQRNQTSNQNNEQARFDEPERNESESEESETEQEDNREDDDYDACEDSEEYSEDCQSENQIQIEEEEESQSEPEVNDDQSDEENYIHMNYPFMPALPEDLEFAQNSYNDPETFDQEYEPNDESFDGTGGLTKAEFLSLPSIVYTSQPIRLKQSKYSSQQDCSICLSHYQDNEILCVLPCEHRFHRNCIDKWLRLNSKCVICKHDLIS